MRKACKLGREVLDLAAAASKPGVTTDEIDKIVHEASLARDVSLPCTVAGRPTLTPDSATLRHSTTATSRNPTAAV